jgi:hypothetical protein
MIAVLGQCPAKCKIVVNIKFIYQVQNFKNHGCEISYGNEKMLN